MRKKIHLFMITIIITLFIGTISANAAVRVSSDSSDRLVAEYSDDYFGANAEKKSNKLAELSIVASDAAYKDTTAFLKSCGFLNIVDKKIINNPLTQQTPMLHPIKVTMGYKTIFSCGKKYDLYAIIIRGTTDALEWVSNFDLTSLNREHADQFVIPKDNIKILFEQYKKDYYTPGATTKIWITGHSRAAAVTNLIAHDLSKKYSVSNVYAYTFASAKVVTKKIDDANIFNYIIQEDIVPKVPPGYMRYGKDIVLNTKGYMYELYKKMTSQQYKGTVAQAHSLEAYMCAFINTITFPQETTKISLNITSKVMYSGQKISLNATVSGGAASKIKWKSSNKKVATVSSSGKVTAKKPGTATITAYVTGNDRKIKKATCSVVVKKETPRISVNATFKAVYPGQKVSLKATVSGLSSKIKWESSNKNVATVTSFGKVTAKRPGTATITAKAGKLTAKCKISVKKPSIKLNKNSAIIYTIGITTLQLKGTVAGASKKIKWSSSNKSIATVNSSGKVTARKSGTVTITATANKVSDECKIKVLNPSIKLNKSSVTIYTSGTTSVQLNASVVGPSKKILWTTSDNNIAAVDSSGKVTAKNSGSTTITATANGTKASCIVTVENPISAYSSYRTLITNYEKKYGAAQVYKSGYTYYWKGLCFAKLLDFNSDGIKELILVYQNGSGTASNINNIKYHVELWTFDGKAAKKICSHVSWTGNNCEYFGYFCIVNYNEKKLLYVSNLLYENELKNIYYGETSSGSLGPVYTYGLRGNIMDSQWYLNNRKISNEEYISDYQKLHRISWDYNFAEPGFEQTIRNEINSTKRILKMN